MKINYEWLETFFEDHALPSAEDLAQTLIFHAYEVEGVEEIDGVPVLDVDVLPNRAADSLSHRGIAHEVSALLNIPLKRDPLRQDIAIEPLNDALRVTRSDDDACSYYVGARIDGVKVGESPAWLKERLESLGQKSINNVVDATNYVLFELGRPTHVFDAQKLAGDTPHIHTRLAKNEEEITLLTGETVALTDKMTLIVDGESDAPLAVGGVKGGVHAEVDESTTDVIIEVANFDPTATRLTAQKLKIRTDASTRFENNMADRLAQYGATALVELIMQVAGGELRGYAHDGEIVGPTHTVTVTPAEVHALLGVEISTEEMLNILTRLGCSYVHESDAITVTHPFERRDLNIAPDIIEEIGRVYGYNKIESAELPAPERPVQIHQKFAYAEKIREALRRIGVSEVYLYSLRDTGDVKLQNALASDKNHLRKNLSDGVAEALDRAEKQMPLLGLYDAVRLFEIGNVFTKDGETTHVGIGIRVAGTKKREQRTQEAFEEVRTALGEALGTTLPEADGEVLEFSLDELVANLPGLEGYDKVPHVAEGVSYAAASPYPFVLRDIAVWVPSGTLAHEVCEIVAKHSGALLQRNDLFDTFEKDGRTSYAFHLVFQSMEETLTDATVGAIMSAIEEDISTRENWEIR